MVLGCLKKRGEMETMHGQIILGIMVLQDITAVFALASGCGSERYKEILVAEIRRHAMARRLAPREQAIRSG